MADGLCGDVASCTEPLSGARLDRSECQAQAKAGSLGPRLLRTVPAPDRLTSDGGFAGVT
jgi:hypothetical protein